MSKEFTRIFMRSKVFKMWGNDKLVTLAEHSSVIVTIIKTKIDKIAFTCFYVLKCIDIKII